MNENYTDISVILDRSGSMASVVQDTIGGFNTFLKEQQAVPGECNLTLVQFDNEYERVFDRRRIAEVPELTRSTYVPRGSTALLDAIGRTVVDTGAYLSRLPENLRPGKVVMVVITDGHENASREFNREQIALMIKRQQEVYSWQFIYLGANQDAITVAAQYNFLRGQTMSYSDSHAGHQAMYASVSSNIKNYRVGASLDTSFSAEQRATQDALIAEDES